MLLELRNISKSFGGLDVLLDISFGVAKGEIVGLIGPNGAGKTTTFNLITGIYPPNGGDILFQGKTLLGRKAHQICHSGIARTFQLVRVFPTMTVFDNVLEGAVYSRRMHGRKKVREWAMECLELLKIGHLCDHIAGRLTYSDRRLLEIARALAAKPELALLDEPLAGLNPSETQQIMAVIQQIRQEHGISILWIEHKIDAVFNLCDRVVVLDYGRLLADGDPRIVAANKKVVEAYLGEPVA
jgi:branched-chain amino acid transport system ATP-binding protein